LKSDEILSTFTELGLTSTQARTYLTLLQTGPVTAKELARNANISRPDIYRIVPYLQKEGLVEKLMTKPACFQATPAEDVLTILLKRKTEEKNELDRKTGEALTYLRSIPVQKQYRSSTADFIVVPCKEAIIQRLKGSILEAKVSIFAVTSKKRFSASILEFGDAHQQALERGTKIKIATEEPMIEAKALKKLRTLTQYENFEVKYFDSPPPAIVSIFDNNEAYVTMSATAQLNESSALRSSNSSFVALAQNYFKDKWNSATTKFNP
jgi:sugar-specific transcriptional regulator TrmB